jgi:hypothetical protein
MPSKVFFFNFKMSIWCKSSVAIRESLNDGLLFNYHLFVDLENKTVLKKPN